MVGGQEERNSGLDGRELFLSNSSPEGSYRKLLLCNPLPPASSTLRLPDFGQESPHLPRIRRHHGVHEHGQLQVLPRTKLSRPSDDLGSPELSSIGRRFDPFEILYERRDPCWLVRQRGDEVEEEEAGDGSDEVGLPLEGVGGGVDEGRC